MTSTDTAAVPQVPDAVPDPSSPLLADLQQAEIHLHHAQGLWKQQAADTELLHAQLAASQEETQDLTAQLDDLRAQLAQAHRTTLGLTSQLGDLRAQVADAQEESQGHAAQVEATRRQLAEAHAEAEHHRQHTQHLTEGLKDIHRALFSGNVYDLLLKVCLTITGSTHGVYITMRSEDDVPRVRAAIDVDGYPQAPPSQFLTALCRKVIADNDSFVANCAADLADLPAPDRSGERFHNFVVAPVVLMHSLNGIVVVADKLTGDFSKQDAETLLSIGDQAGVAVENVHLRRQLQQAYLSTVSVMADAMEAKDSQTQGHCAQVSRYARRIVQHLNLSDYERSVVLYAALLHDIGKIGVSDGILNKPGPLLAEERELIKSHVRVGHDLIRHVPVLERVARVVLHHHEAYDGSGYPDGLKGDEIPMASRIVGAVDAYCAMISKRSYKEAYSDEWARNELQRCAGSQFDPQVVETFLSILDEPDHRDTDDEDDAALDAVLPGFSRLRELQHIPH